MNNKLHSKALALILLYFIFSHAPVLAQNTIQDLNKTIRHHDSLFWQAYNKCDLPNQEKYLTDDLEFYHDKGGFAKGREQTMENIRKNLCSNNNFRLRRDAVPGTTEVFPLTKNDTIYGAIFSGDHLFYAIENNNPPRLTGKAKFTSVWILQNNTWKMSRILSYDHGPATASKAMIQLPGATLDLYVGSYNAPQSGKLIVRKEGDHLVMLAGEKHYEIYPESANKFFLKDRDLIFEFTKGNDGKISKMTVWENGKIAEEAVREK
jgi:hypothetical protein